MQINIKATKAKLTPEAHQIIEEKVSGLSHYCDCIIGADVEIGITSFHHRKGDIFFAEVNLEVPGKLLRARAETEDIMQSINQVRDKLKIELNKYKDLRQK